MELLLRLWVEVLVCFFFWLLLSVVPNLSMCLIKELWQTYFLLCLDKFVDLLLLLGELGVDSRSHFLVVID